MKQRLLLTIFAAVLSLCSWANGTKIDGFYYVLDSSSKTASVTYTGAAERPNSGFEVSGDIAIPASVWYSGIKYTVTGIGTLAFGKCTGLTSVIIPESVTSIGDYAFWDCSGLTSITITNSVTKIGPGAFYNCTRLTSIVVESGNKVYDSRENCNAIIKTKPNTLIVGCSNTFIPNSVTSIEKYAFYGCVGLTSITLPESLKNIGASAFNGCADLKNITISESVKSIGEKAFANCTGLTDVYALRTDAEEYNAGSDAFYNCPLEDITLHVPTGSTDSYDHTEPWCDFGTIVVDITPTALSLTRMDDATDATYYNLQGQRVTEPQRGLNIIRYSNGTSKKVLVK